MFSREKYKVYTEHLSLARKHIERAEKIIQAITDMLSYNRRLLELNEREAVKSVWIDQATFYRNHAGTAVRVRHVLNGFRLVQFAVHL